MGPCSHLQPTKEAAAEGYVQESHAQRAKSWKGGWGEGSLKQEPAWPIAGLQPTPTGRPEKALLSPEEQTLQTKDE